jgi:hypothetical protein
LIIIKLQLNNYTDNTEKSLYPRARTYFIFWSIYFWYEKKFQLGEKREGEAIYMEGTGYRSPARNSSARGLSARNAAPGRENARSRTDKYNDTAFAETVLTQCIISGVILLIILLMCLVKTDFTRELRTSLKVAIAKDSEFLSAENITSVFDFSFVTQEEPAGLNIPEGGAPAGGFEADAEQSGKPEAEGESTPDEMLIEEPPKTPAYTDFNTDAPDAAEGAQNYAPTEEMRIDEDILEEINSRTEPYSEN